jgi:hypothetical protein
MYVCMYVCMLSWCWVGFLCRKTVICMCACMHACVYTAAIVLLYGSTFDRYNCLFACTYRYVCVQLLLPWWWVCPSSEADNYLSICVYMRFHTHEYIHTCMYVELTLHIYASTQKTTKTVILWPLYSFKCTHLSLHMATLHRICVCM